ncbi:Fanconi anemia core complex-associated protein 20 [Lithobates pipiens]
MTEERAAKLKLKRKKCSTTVQGAQETEIKLQSLPALDLRQNFAGSWFDEIDLTTAEQLWKQVLTCMSTDPRSVGWRSVPGLPDFTHQVARQGQEKTTVLEVFEVGHQSFEWFPLPTAIPSIVSKESCTADLRHEPSQSNDREKQLAEPMLSKSRTQSPQSLNAVNNLELSFLVTGSKKNELFCNKNSTEDHEELQSGATKNIKELMAFQRSTTDGVKAPLASQKSFIKNIKVPQNLQKDLVDAIKEPKTSQKRSKKAIQGLHVSQKGSEKNAREPQAITKQTVYLWPTVTLAKNSKGKEEPEWAKKTSDFTDVMDIEEPVSASEGKLQVMQESADKTEAAGSLDSCPICLMQFPKQFAQLDMDSHLAQCLSETTVDVVW